MSNDNAYAEALFRTCKYVPDFPTRGFESLTEARAWVHGFVHWYNHEHRHSRIHYVTPSERHQGQDQAILARRRAIYAEARAAHLRRWTGNTRDWYHVSTVWLNPEKGSAPTLDKDVA